MCFALVLGKGSASGDAAKKAELIEQAKVSAYGDAMINGAKDASALCPEGHSCRGALFLDGPANVIGATRTVNGQAVYSCIVFFSGYYEGVCEKDGQRVKVPEPKERKRLVADTITDLVRQIEKLPELPKTPKGDCQLYRISKERDRPVCAGSCEEGECKRTPKTYIATSEKGEKVYVLECVCD